MSNTNQYLAGSRLRGAQPQESPICPTGLSRLSVCRSMGHGGGTARGRGRGWGQLFILDLNWMESASLFSDESSHTPSSSGSRSSLASETSALISLLLEEGLPPFRVQVGRGKPCRPSPTPEQEVRQKILSYNRKEKSLEELSRKFIENFEGGEGEIMELDKVTKRLDVERRRIYDIVNIFEALGVVAKAYKNNYVWRGLRMAVQKIRVLKELGPKHPIPSQKKEKSLENLAGRFLQLFIFTTEAVALEDAARVLIRTEGASMAKTKIRRLYDIVNVFKSIGLVQKVPLLGKKSGFEWMGIGELEDIVACKAHSRQMMKCEEEYPMEMEPYVPPPCEPSKENMPVLENRERRVSVDKWEEVGRMSGWTSLRRQFQDSGERYFNPHFSQKPFFPAIISQSSLLSSSSSLNDQCPAY